MKFFRCIDDGRASVAATLFGRGLWASRLGLARKRVYRKERAGAAELDERAPREPGAAQFSGPHEATCGAANERVGAMSVQRRHPAEAQPEGACAARGGPEVPFVGSALLAAVLAIVLAPGAFAQSILSPNQPVVIELPIENEAPSTATAYGVQLTATIENAQPAGLAAKVRVDTQGSDLGPADIEVGADKAKTFRVRLVADADAPDGTFELKLLPKFQESPHLVSPDPDALETTVKCITRLCRFLDENRA